MENDTAIPIVSDCRSVAYERDPLWIVGMVTVSVISTLVALILKKPRGVARAPLPRTRGEEEEMV